MALPKNNPNVDDKSLVPLIRMATTIVVAKKLFETALVNTAAEYLPFPFKPKKKEEKSWFSL
jgi:hypothetical protein